MFMDAMSKPLVQAKISRGGISYSWGKKYLGQRWWCTDSHRPAAAAAAPWSMRFM